MGKKLVIAEKPSVAMDYASALMCKDRKDGYVEGNDYIITWAFGHLFSLKEPADYDKKYKVWNIETLPIIPDSFGIKLNKGAAKQFSVIKDLIHRSDINSIIIGTDAGREGELIARYILLAAKNNKTVQRLWISTLTEADIKKGFKELKPISSYDNLYYAAAARNEIDWLMGINYTRAYTKKKGKNVLLSIGRCQTPILNLIVQRELQIEIFMPEPYYEVTADFGDYAAKYIKNNNSRIDDKEVAEKIKDEVCHGLGKIVKVEKEEKRKPHPQLYNLTNLQRVMNRKYGFSAQKTLDTAQGLYEKHKILSYPRTSSRHLSESLIPEFPERLDCLSFGDFKAAINIFDMRDLKTSKRFIDDSKISDHHAIIPTLNKNIKDIYKQLSNDEKLLFDEVALNFISCFYPDYIYEYTTVITTVEEHEFITKGKRDIEAGWKRIYQDAEENNESEEQILLELIEGETRKVLKAEIENKT